MPRVAAIWQSGRQGRDDKSSNLRNQKRHGIRPHRPRSPSACLCLFVTKNRERADDLVQDTIVGALTEAHAFQPGTNLRVRMFTVLRSLHCSELRTSQIRIQSLDDPFSYEPAVLPGQIASLEFGDFCRAFWQLGDDRREALILVGASGLSYEEAAKVCGCTKGTIKSRVSRLRILEDGLLADKRRDTPALAGYVGHLLDSRRAASPAPSAQQERRSSPAYHAAPFGS